MLHKRAEVRRDCLTSAVWFHTKKIKFPKNHFAVCGYVSYVWTRLLSITSQSSLKSNQAAMLLSAAVGKN